MEASDIRREAQAAAAAGDMPRLVELAKAYTRFLSPMFNLIPWDKDLLIGRNRFEAAYAFAASATRGFLDTRPERLADVILERPETLVVFRTIAGYRAQELAYVAEHSVGVKVTAEAVRRLESGKRHTTGGQRRALGALAEAVHLLINGTAGLGAPQVEGFIDRREKFDTADGWTGVARSHREGLTYVAALYERYLGRPFAYAVDALSGKKADLLERPVESLLLAHGIDHYRSKPIDRIPGFAQAPDFLIPDRDSPRIVIEAKLAEDGGTARDKASRIERLSRITEPMGVALIAVIDGKGFFRINDVLAPILAATKGLTFTLATLGEMLDVPALAPYRRS